MEEDAPRRAGLLDMLVMKYDRRMLDSGRRERCGIVVFVGAVAPGADVSPAMDGCGGTVVVAGFERVLEVCIRRRLPDCWPCMPYCTTQTLECGIVYFCDTLKSAVPAVCRPFILPLRLSYCVVRMPKERTNKGKKTAPLTYHSRLRPAMPFFNAEPHV